jgi:uncharacterized membrane protein YgcG
VKFKALRYFSVRMGFIRDLLTGGMREKLIAMHKMCSAHINNNLNVSLIRIQMKAFAVAFIVIFPAVSSISTTNLKKRSHHEGGWGGGWGGGFGGYGGGYGGGWSNRGGPKW